MNDITFVVNVESIIGWVIGAAVFAALVALWVLLHIICAIADAGRKRQQRKLDEAFGDDEEDEK